MSRETAKSLAFRGIVTFGTPHSGVPLLGGIPAAHAYLNGMVSSFFGLAFAYWARCDYMDLDCWAAYILFTNYFDLLWVPAAGDAILDQLLPSQALQEDDAPGSVFLSSLNSASNLAAEQSHAPARAGLVVTTQNYFYGGFLRLLIHYNDANNVAGAANIVGVGGLLEAYYWQQRADEMYPACSWESSYCDWWLYWTTQNLAFAWFDASSYLLGYEWAWCSLVTGSNDCLPNDALIPVWSQEYPGASVLPMAVSSIWDHTREWEDGNVIGAVHQQVQAILQGQ